MTNEDKAVGLINSAILNKEHISLYGDYDVDGLCSLLIARDFFVLLNYDNISLVKYTLRTHHISVDVINDALNNNSGLVIIMDTGSGDADKIELQKLSKFTKVIICDHHTPQYNYDELDNCTFINPGFYDNFPYLSGACIVYELCISYYNTYHKDEVAKAKKFLSFLACASLYSDSVFNNNFYTKELLSQAKISIIPKCINYIPYITASKRFFLFSFAPPFNACFRNNRLDLINNLLLSDALTYLDKNSFITSIDKLRGYSREVVSAISSECKVTELDNIVFTDLTGLLNQNIPNQYIRNNKGLIANILAAKYKKCAVTVVSDGSKYLISVRDYYNRDIFKLFNPFYDVGGHKPAFGGTLSNSDRLDVVSKLKYFDKKIDPVDKQNIVPFSYANLERIALENEYNQQNQVVLVRVPASELVEQWTPDSFTEKFIQYKLVGAQIYIKKMPWCKSGQDLLVHLYYTDRVKAESVMEVDYGR